MAKQQRRQIGPPGVMEQQMDTVYKIVEVVGVSEKSWEDAGRIAVGTRPVRFATFGWPKSPKWT